MEEAGAAGKNEGQQRARRLGADTGGGASGQDEAGQQRGGTRSARWRSSRGLYRRGTAALGAHSTPANGGGDLVTSRAAPLGPDGLRRACGWAGRDAGRAFGLDQLGKDRVFSNLFLMRKQIPEKSRNCLKARKNTPKIKKNRGNFLEID
jgi:hypothetical protein